MAWLVFHILTQSLMAGVKTECTSLSCHKDPSNKRICEHLNCGREKNPLPFPLSHIIFLEQAFNYTRRKSVCFFKLRFQPRKGMRQQSRGRSGNNF